MDEERYKPDKSAAFEPEQEPEERFIDRVKNRKTERDRYFAGYTTREEIKDSSGKIVRYREYTGDYFRQDTRVLNPVAHRVFCGIAFAAAIALFVAALIINAPANKCWYTMMAALVTIVFFGLGIIALVEYLPSQAKLLDHQYRFGAKAFKRDLRFILAGFALQFITMLIQIIIDPASRQITDLYRGLLLVAAAGVILAIERIESSIVYTQVYAWECSEE